ncbi:putative L-type lectin-domain containing receptor kinase S.5, partial [Mucuna pruriens]
MCLPWLVKYQLAATIFIIIALTKVIFLYFNFPTFQTQDAAHLLLSKCSNIYLNTIQVTPDIPGDNSNYSGSVICREQLKLWNSQRGMKASFNSTFVFNLNPLISPGDEGLAFILTADTSLPSNSADLKLRKEVLVVDLDLSKQLPEDIFVGFSASTGLKELVSATRNFHSSNKLGKGGFGMVYRGTLNGKDVAVKRISKNLRHGKQDFIAEITTIGNLNHKKLVKLIGWTLDYLHNGCDKRVLHRDIKPSNLMLDSEFNARLGDFGLARTIHLNEKSHHSTREIAGTPGYMAPESFHTRRSAVETDFYAFGILILEVVCGGRKAEHKQDLRCCNSIVDLVCELHGRENITDAVDLRLNGDFDKAQAKCLLELGLACRHPNPYERPSMKTGVAGEAAPPFVAFEKPAFTWPTTAPVLNQQLNFQPTLSQNQPITELISGR